MGDRPHCYLEIVATRPEQQRRGAAAQVLRWGCEYADARGLDCYLEAGPDLVGLYGKFGFEVVGTFAPSRMPSHTESFMVRQPQGAVTG
jgi:ribosomal protein S18 acetylase RimI-like enzyme